MSAFSARFEPVEVAVTQEGLRVGPPPVGAHSKGRRQIMGSGILDDPGYSVLGTVAAERARVAAVLDTLRDRQDAVRTALIRAVASNAFSQELPTDDLIAEAVRDPHLAIGTKWRGVSVPQVWSDVLQRLVERRSLTLNRLETRRLSRRVHQGADVVSVDLAVVHARNDVCWYLVVAHDGPARVGRLEEARRAATMLVDGAKLFERFLRD